MTQPSDPTAGTAATVATPARQRGAWLKEQRWLDADALNVLPALGGQPLASPARRALAMLVDLALLALLGDAAGLWLVAGLVLVALLLRSKRLAENRRQRIGWIFAAVLGLLALQEAWDSHGPRSGARQAAEAQAEALADAAELRSEAAELAAERVARGLAAAPTSAATHPAAAASAGGLSDADRIAQLQAEVAEMKQPKPMRWRHEFQRAIESVGISFGWGMVYFSLLPAWWNGQTLGKKLLQLRVVELTGRPLTVMRCLRRYGGYAAGMATGGLGFLQLLWDVNRQGIQDRVAHTVVIDQRVPPAAARPTS
jgi:uncharacterized RDD family membrane protein YckC